MNKLDDSAETPAGVDPLIVPHTHQNTLRVSPAELIRLQTKVGVEMQTKLGKQEDAIAKLRNDALNLAREINEGVELLNNIPGYDPFNAARLKEWNRKRRAWLTRNGAYQPFAEGDAE